MLKNWTFFCKKENSTCRLKIIRNCYYETKGDSGNIFLQWNWHIEIIFCNFDFFQFFLCLLRAVFMYKTFIKSCVFWKNAFLSFAEKISNFLVISHTQTLGYILKYLSMEYWNNLTLGDKLINFLKFECSFFLKITFL